MKLSDVSFALSRLIVDAGTIMCGLLLAYFWRMHWYQAQIGEGSWQFFPAPTTYMTIEVFIGWAIKITAVIILVLIIRGEYRFQAEEKFSREITHLFWSLMAGLAIVLAYFFFAQWHFFSRLVFGLGSSFALLFLVVGRTFLRQIRLQLYRQGWGRKRILVIGSGSIAAQVIERLKSQPQYEIDGLMTEQKSAKKILYGLPVLGALKSFEAILKKERSTKSGSLLTRELKI